MKSNRGEKRLPIEPNLATMTLQRRLALEPPLPQQQQRRPTCKALCLPLRREAAWAGLLRRPGDSRCPQLASEPIDSLKTCGSNQRQG